MRNSENNAKIFHAESIPLFCCTQEDTDIQKLPRLRLDEMSQDGIKSKPRQFSICYLFDKVLAFS